LAEGRRTLVTGALGCLGAWTIKALLAAGEEPVGYDLGTDEARLRLVLEEGERRRVTLLRGDITDAEALGRALDRHEITHVIHLAALQLPFCRADPIRGARVNIVGTATVFQTVKERRDRIQGIAYASSTAVYNGSDPSPAPESGGAAPTTLYGVYKLANEGTARVFWEDEGVASIGIRPYVVYGAGRDQGLTSGPSLAMAAAARGEGFDIQYGGTVQYDFAADVGEAFVQAAQAAADGAHVANFPGGAWSIEDMVAAIETAAPDIAGRITWVEQSLPFPESLEATLLERLVGPVTHTPLAQGVRRTIEQYRARGR
jgi:UDP-glucuronate 4-epimerase